MITKLVSKSFQEILILRTTSRYFPQNLRSFRATRRCLLMENLRARLQYDLSQQSRLVDQLPFSSIELLDLALESHRYALELNQGNADLLL